MPMRGLCLILLCGLAVAPAAYAGARASTDGVLELDGVNATSLTITGLHGTLWGQMGRGRLVVTDPVPGDGQIFVSGADRSHLVSDTVTVYSGTEIHFRITGGRYKLAFKPLGTDTGARGIDLTAVGVGTASLAGDPLADETGQYALDDGKWLDVPLALRTLTFGVQPSSGTTTTP